MYIFSKEIFENTHDLLKSLKIIHAYGQHDTYLISDYKRHGWAQVTNEVLSLSKWISITDYEAINLIKKYEKNE